MVTFDHEHVPTEHIRRAGRRGRGASTRPPDALLHAQDKRVDARAAGRAGRSRSRAGAGGDPGAGCGFGAELRWPASARRPAAATTAAGVWLLDDGRRRPSALLAGGTELIVEERVPLRRELAAQVARSPFGQVAAYPVVETVQRDGICVEVLAPRPGLARGARRAGPAAGHRPRHRAGRGRPARRRAVRDGPRRAGGQRAGHAAAQLRALDHRGRPDLAVRAAPAGGAGLPDGRHGADRAGRGDGQRARRTAGRHVASTSGCTTCSPPTRAPGCTCTASRSGPAARSGTSRCSADDLDAGPGAGRGGRPLADAKARDQRDRRSG